MSGSNNLQCNEKKKLGLEQISSVSISLASPEEIRSWSQGEVTKPIAFDARIRTADGSFKPRQLVEGGLLCQKIFGPVTSYRCACEKYRGGKKARAKDGTVCDRCGVLVANRSVRRQRMGHIELATPVVHPFFFHGAPSILTDLFKVVLDVHQNSELDPITIKPSLIERIVYRELSMELESDEQATCETTLTGAEGIRALLAMLRRAIANAKSRIDNVTTTCLSNLGCLGKAPRGQALRVAWVPGERSLATRDISK